MLVPWQRLIRFVADDARILRGEPILPYDGFDLGDTTEETKLRAKFISGLDIYDTSGNVHVTDEVAVVKKLLGPLIQEDVPILRCGGLNYATHIKEAGRKPPPFLSIFFKPNTTVLDHGADVIIPGICQNDQADYEGELCIVLGKVAEDVAVSEALDYIGAYTCGNYVSSRKLQRDPAFAGNVPQWGFSKGFDTYAPLEPCLVRPDVVGDTKALLLRTIVDGWKGKRS